MHDNAVRSNLRLGIRRKSTGLCRPGDGVERWSNRLGRDGRRRNDAFTSFRNRKAVRVVRTPWTIGNIRTIRMNFLRPFNAALPDDLASTLISPACGLLGHDLRSRPDGDRLDR